MNKQQVFFGVLFCSWILGVSLICLFPPLPNYEVANQSTEYLSPDSSPELHLRNTSQAGFSHSDLGIELIGLIFAFQFDGKWDLLFSLHSCSSPIQIASFFDAKILFRAFFETW